MRHRCRIAVSDRCRITVHDVTTPCQCAHGGRDAGIFCRDIEPACSALVSFQIFQNSLAGLYCNDVGLFCNDIGLFRNALVRCFGIFSNDSELCCGDTGLFCTSTCCLSTPRQHAYQGAFVDIQGSVAVRWGSFAEIQGFLTVRWGSFTRMRGSFQMSTVG